MSEWMGSNNFDSLPWVLSQTAELYMGSKALVTKCWVPCQLHHFSVFCTKGQFPNHATVAMHIPMSLL